LHAYGESELLENDEVVREMLVQAGNESNQQVLLDTDTFCKALTNDVELYDIKTRKGFLHTLTMPCLESWVG
jgi:hypothetical protein